jgi:GxxExxY protein
MNGPDNNNLTQLIIGLAMRVHTRLGPGLLESVYERCLCHEFGQSPLAGIAVRTRKLRRRTRS